MLRTKWITLILFFLSLNLFAQNGALADYNHVIIPTKFIIQDKENDFQLNSLVRFLFKEGGFNVFMDSELIPDEYRTNPCNGLRVGLEKKNNILKIYITVNLYNCQNDVVFSSEGSSREKMFKDAYQEAIRLAFKDIESANYSLNTSNSSNSIAETTTLSKEEEIEMRKQVVRDQSEVFDFDKKTFYFLPVDDEIHIYESNAYDISAKLTPINETMFIYNSDELDGVISRKENGDFELEYREPTSKETKFSHYKLIRRAD